MFKFVSSLLLTEIGNHLALISVQTVRKRHAVGVVPHVLLNLSGRSFRLKLSGCSLCTEKRKFCVFGSGLPLGMHGMYLCAMLLH